jgi:octanoyl-[GcvH]:protein N-octanoyltransferase
VSPEYDTGLSHALLRLAGAGEIGEVLRIHVPRRIVAFGRQDTVSRGYPEAVAAARREGFAPIERLAGGRAAVFTEQTLAFAWAVPTSEPRSGVTERFARIASIMASAFRALGVDARIGRVPGEYCPGDHSVNSRNAVKLMGVGQRVVGGAAHVGGVVVVDGSDLIRQALVPVYRALGLAWDPATAGDLASEAPGVTLGRVRAAILDEFAREADLVPWRPDRRVRSLARELAVAHLPLR